MKYLSGSFAIASLFFMHIQGYAMMAGAQQQGPDAIRAIQANITDLRSNLNRTNERIQPLEESTRRLTDNVGNLTTRTGETNNTVTRLRNTITALENRITALENRPAPQPVPPSPPAPQVVQAPINPRELQGFVGEIRYSVLDERTFRRLYGHSWELLKGQVLRPTDDLIHVLPEEMEHKLPDARGRFLRGKNHNRGRDTGNPEGDLRMGESQDDIFKTHRHGGGNHKHKYNGGNAGGTVFGDHTCTVHNYSGNNIDSGDSGDIIRDEGGNETRPRCVTVNVFVKVR